MNAMQGYHYYSHDLNIQMRTSSGDTINMEFSNTQELSVEQNRKNDAGLDSFSFASMKSYRFHMDSNGIDEQDKKEIEAFMKTAQPYIDNFVKELESGERHTPLNQAVKTVSDIFASVEEKSLESKNYAKNGIVKLMDNALKQVEQHQKLLDDSQAFLDKIFDRMEKYEAMIYA